MITRLARQRTTLLLFLLMALNTIPVFSQSESVITSIQIIGLKRTKLRVAEEPLRRFIGQEASSLDTDQVKAAIIDLGILEPLAITVADNAGETGKTLVVEIREKWTIFPIPIFFAGSGGVSGGLAFFDTNAFGMNHKMGVVGMYQNEGGLAMALYMAPPVGSGYFGWTANAAFSQGEKKNSNEKDNILRRFKTRSFSVSLTPQYQITSAMSAAFHTSYVYTMFLDSDNPIRKPDVPGESRAQFIRLGPEFSIRSSTWDGYLLSEGSVSVKYHLIQNFDPSTWHSLSFRGVYEKPIIPGFRLAIRGGGLYRPDVPPLLESGPHEAEVNIFPDSFSARHYAGLSLGLEKYLYRFSFGTISLLGAWQMAYSNGPILEERFDYGVTGSLRLYMSRLAIPAMGFGVAYNIPADYFRFSFSIGMTL